MPDLNRVVVVGASAGGLEALVTITASLPADLNAAVFIVLHTAAKSMGLLPHILSRASQLKPAYASDGERIEPSRIYVARPDQHLILTPDVVRLSHGPKENGFRPAVDPLFRSAAGSFGPKTIGVVLSGGLHDGAAGLRAIKRAGGFAIVQDPEEAPFQGMPTSALEMGPVDYTLMSAQIGPILTELARDHRRRSLPASTEDPPGYGIEPQNPPSTMTCPECHGVLWEVKGSPQFRCRVGHSYSVSRLMELQDDGVEKALWAAVRAMEESGSLARRLGETAGLEDQTAAAQYFLGRAREKERHADVIRQLLQAKPAVPRKRKRKAVAKRAARANVKP